MLFSIELLYQKKKLTVGAQLSQLLKGFTILS